VPTDIPQLTIGNATVSLLNDGFWWDDGGAMFGVVPKDRWAEEKPPDAHNRIHMSLVCPLILADGEAILVDAGIGNRLSAKERDIYRPARGAGIAGALRRLGMEPADITMVILSHLHFDHCGGIVNRTETGATTIAFPRARHLIQRREWEGALHPTNDRLAAAYRHAAECIAPLAGRRLQLLDGPTAVTPSVRTLVTGGHTPSHQCVVVECEDAGLVHLADLAPTVPHLRSSWMAAYDLDPMECAESKMRLLAEATTKNWWISLDHDDLVASGRIRGDARRPAIFDTIRTPEPC
jgi:glyoxylase-like metal-dependent hydrolase (beta-lactamase superfamily II)